MTLTEFLLARIAEDEEVARAGAERYDAADWSIGSPDGSTSFLWGYLPVVSSADPGTIEPNVAAQVVRWGPARVLVECAAKRQVLALHHMAEAMVGRATINTDHFRAVVTGVEAVLPLLALPYASHPDFRQEWLPKS